VAFAEANASWLKVLTAPQNAAVVAAANKNPTPANLAAFQKAVGPVVFAKAVANLKTLNAIVVPYQSQLTYLSAHQSELLKLQDGINRSPKQWQDWFWVCLGGMVLFIPTIWLNRGRWSPAKAREDESRHESDVAEELRELVGSGTSTNA
jgi:ATP adenylyltransferase/5',5'''-P-1,P-4-tetraphosphate phosphorylase II